MSTDSMRLIVGLGNPGDRYHNTRHNIGFMAAERIAERLGCDSVQAKFSGIYQDCRTSTGKVGILRPQTFMNRSGNSVQQALNWYKIENDQLLVVYDDLDLPFGEVRLRRKGSAAGHNGLSSIIQQRGGDDIPRLRIGIGRPAHGDTVSYVLSRFSREEESYLPTVIEHASDAALHWITSGIDDAMGKYNGINVLSPVE